MRIVQVSDTHISATHTHFQANVDIIAQAIDALKPDLIVHTGDISMDGALTTADLELAARWNDARPAEVLAIPGNHDVGDLATNRPDQPVTAARLADWAEIVGPDRWKRSYGGWQFIGINAMILGTGLPQEDDQYAWLASELDADRPVALFTHKPLCIESLAEGPRGYWTIAPEPRARLLDALAGKPVRLIASGHLHIQHEQVIDGTRHLWGPASSFIVGPAQEDLGGERVLGLVEHVLEGGGITSRFIRPQGLEELQLDPVRNQIYPT